MNWEAIAAAIGSIIALLGLLNVAMMNQVRLELSTLKLQMEELRTQIAKERLQDTEKVQEQLNDRFMSKESVTGWMKSLEQRLIRIEGRPR